MNFLIKIEEAINQLIIRLLEKLKVVSPQFIFIFMDKIAHLPSVLKVKLGEFQLKLRAFGSIFTGFIQRLITILRGHLTGFIIYLRSDEFKKADKRALILTPIKEIKAHPLRTVSGLFTVMIIASAGTILYQNTAKIISGTHSLRKPASLENAEEDLYFELKNHKFEVKISATTGDLESELFLDIKIEAHNAKDKKYLELMEDKLKEKIESFHPHIDQLPLTNENRLQMEIEMTLSLNSEFQKIGHDSPVKAIYLKQVLPARPQYFRQADRMLAVTEINLQIFLENISRNRQVWIDFSILTSNRNAILYLKDHEVEFKDHLTTNVEPVIPQLPVEEEGRLIIKDKIKLELNQFLEKNGIEGKVLEVYIDYLIAS